MRRGATGIATGLALALALAACTDKPDSDAARDASAADDRGEASAPIPATAEAFLAELLPLPDGAAGIEVHYAITGPALTGTLTTTIAPGGLRHDRWEMKSTAGSEALGTSGFTIINAAEIFTGTTPGGGKRRVNHLDALARAYLELDADTRAAVVESIRAWQRTLAEQRGRHQGERGEVLGVSCLQTRVAAQNVCMWEETGLPLAYEGAAFSITATKIDRNATLDAGAFEAPADAASFERATSDASYDYAAVLTELAQGSYGEVSVLVLGAKGVPDLRLPTSERGQDPGQDGAELK